jgi:signal peptidase I
MLALVPWFGVIVWGYLLFAPTDSRADTPDTPVALHLLAGLLAVAVFLFVASRAFWAPYWIASGNMKPGLMVGDYLFVVFAQADELARGDVVVFRADATGDAQIGRLIGLPGDSVQMRAGKILLNGLEVPQTRAPALSEVYVPQGPLRSLPRCGNAPVGAGGQCVTLRSYETLPDGRTYDVLDLVAGGFGDDTAVFTIPTGQYFMLGDNRDDSLDSRFDSSVGGLGMVAGGNVIARARRVAFSTTGAQLLAVWHWRSGRFWQGVL